MALPGTRASAGNGEVSGPRAYTLTPVHFLDRTKIK